MSKEEVRTLDAAAETMPSEGAEAAPGLRESPRRFSPWERVRIFIGSWVGTAALWLIGRSVRWEIHGRENFEAAEKMGKGMIYAAWHREIFAATWFWRKRGIMVMTSRNFDGEVIARIIRRFGYGAARGSSSRGSTSALMEMIRGMGQGLPAGFTIDGPRGPRFVAKPGAVLLAKATGAPILCFHIAPRRAWVFEKSWDRFQVPRPFTRAAIFIAPPVLVSSQTSNQTVRGEAGALEQSRKLEEVQRALDLLRAEGMEWLKEQGVSARRPGA